MAFKVLIVDDSPITRIMIREMLETLGHQVVGEAESGRGGIDSFKSLKPDLMTLDISMPGKDGGKVYETLRMDPEIRAIRVCIVTGKPELRKLIYERPVPPPEGYLDKPVDEETLLRNVRKILELA